MTTPKEPREFILHGGYTVIFDKAEVVYVSESSKKIDDTLDIHVIEHAAYEVVCAERDNAVAALNHPTSERMGHLIRERDEARVEIERLLVAYKERGMAMRETGDALRSLYESKLTEQAELLSKYEAALKDGVALVQHIQDLEYLSQGGSTEHWAHRYLEQSKVLLGLKGEE